MEVTPNSIKRTKRHFSASGSILLPLALKWRLVGLLVACILSCVGAQSASAASITLSTPSSLSVNVTPSASGTFAKSNKGSISVISDAYAGYTFTIRGKTDNNALVSGNNKLLSITEADGIDELSFNTPAHNDMWGYRPSKMKGTTNINFFPGPKTVGDIIDVTNPSNNVSKSIEYTIELGVRVDNSQPAGTYTGTFVFTASANDLHYTISYNGNAADATNVPAQKTGNAAEGSTIKIDAAPTRSGYGFRGWCDQKPEDETCTGKTYWPETFYSLVNGSNTLNLYAMWVEASQMQNWDECSTLTEHQTVYLIDLRDNNTYKVRKLKDGQCWMVENPRLGGNEAIKLTKADSDISGEWTLPAGINQLSTDNSDNAPQIYTERKNQIVPETNERAGVYYNWYAVTAGTGTYDMDTGNASGSICPSGWRLPTGGPGGDLQALYNKYGYDAITKDDGPNFVRSGFLTSNSIAAFGSRGFYWSSTAHDADKAYTMDINEGYLNAQWNFHKYTGRPVRCIAR